MSPSLSACSASLHRRMQPRRATRRMPFHCNHSQPTMKPMSYVLNLQRCVSAPLHSSAKTHCFETIASRHITSAIGCCASLKSRPDSFDCSPISDKPRSLPYPGGVVSVVALTPEHRALGIAAPHV